MLQSKGLLQFQDILSCFERNTGTYFILKSTSFFTTSISVLSDNFLLIALQGAETIRSFRATPERISIYELSWIPVLTSFARAYLPSVINTTVRISFSDGVPAIFAVSVRVVTDCIGTVSISGFDWVRISTVADIPGLKGFLSPVSTSL